MSLKKIIFVFSLSFFLFFNVNTFFAVESTSNIQSLILEDFELGQDNKPARQWIIIPDRFGKEGSVDSGKSLQEMRWVKAWPETYFGKEIPDKGKGEFFFGTQDTEDSKKRYTDVSGTCMGMKLSFNRQGYNVVDLFPLTQGKDGKFEKTPIPFRGKVRQVDMWVWGSNYNYNMEMVVMDYKGQEYRLQVGNLRHVGWKNFVISIPNYIPQSTTYVSSIRTLALVKLTIWTSPEEKVVGSYVYIDQIKYLTDVFNNLYDGYQLGDPVAVKTLWDKGAAAPNESDVKQ